MQNKTQQLVDFLSTSGWNTASQLKIAGFTDLDIKVALSSEDIQKQGERRGTRYNVTGASEFSKSETVVDSDQKSEALSFVERYGSVSSTFLSTSFDISKDQARIVLQSLVDDNSIVKVGRKKGTMYQVHNYVAPIKEEKLPAKKVNSGDDLAPRKGRRAKNIEKEVSDSTEEVVELSL